jgi:hypothetical protein
MSDVTLQRACVLHNLYEAECKLTTSLACRFLWPVTWAQARPSSMLPTPRSHIMCSRVSQSHDSHNFLSLVSVWWDYKLTSAWKWEMGGVNSPSQWPLFESWPHPYNTGTHIILSPPVWLHSSCQSSQILCGYKYWLSDINWCQFDNILSHQKLWHGFDTPP